MKAFGEPVLVFDIETVPDVETGRRLLGLEGLSDDDVAQAMAVRRQQARGNDFQPVHLHRVVSIAITLRHGDDLRVMSLGERDSDEAELVRQFFGGIDKYRPVLVSWNGSGFDLPVLHFRALKHGVASSKYWDTGHFERDSKWDNYIGRYQFRHTDLMDVLAIYNARNNAPLHETAVLLGLPGKLGMDGSKVAGAYRDGKLDEIRAYCETDALNTYLVYLRFLLVRGQLDAARYAGEIDRVKGFLADSQEAHWREYAEAWIGESSPT